MISNFRHIKLLDGRCFEFPAGHSEAREEESCQNPSPVWQKLWRRGARVSPWQFLRLCTQGWET